MELPIIDRFTMLLRPEKELPESHNWKELDHAEVAEDVVQSLRTYGNPFRALISGGLADLIAADRAIRAAELFAGYWSNRPEPFRSIPYLLLPSGELIPPSVRQMRLWRSELSVSGTAKVLEVLTQAPPDRLYRVQYRYQNLQRPSEWWAQYDGWFLKIAVTEGVRKI
jgi:hypothetical protein